MQSFPYHRSVAPTLALLLGLALIEKMVADLGVMARWGWWIAMVLGLLDVSLVLAPIGLIRAIRRYPATLDAKMLVMRLGTLKVLPVPVSSVAGFREGWDPAALKQPGVVNLAAATWQNRLVELAPREVAREI